jgi:hypothetical protein
MNDKKNRIWIVAMISAMLIIIVILIIVLIPKQAAEPEQVIKINELDKTVKNLPNSELASIESMLRSIVELNIDENSSFDIKDAKVRDGSYNQTVDDDIIVSTFIVDIESLRQSYKVYDYYSSKNNEEIEKSDYNIQVSCLSKKDLIYGEFKCKDRSTIENNLSEVDQLSFLLPHRTENYEVSLNGYDLDHKGNLSVVVYVSKDLVTNKSAIDEVVQREIEAIREWIRSEGADPANYNISYVTGFRD